MGGVLGILVLGSGSAASAHPLGNATVNHYDGLHLFPDHLADLGVEDTAEIPTLQRKGLIDTNGDGSLSVSERVSYAARQCSALASADSISVNGHRLRLTVVGSDYSERPGAIQLKIGRLVCRLDARADLTRPSTVAISDNWDGDGIGWHEITAVATGLSLKASPFPASSISAELLRYPNDLLSSPLDVRGGTVATEPGAGGSTYSPIRQLPAAGFLVRALNRLANTFNRVVGSKHVTIGVGLLAIVLSMLLGAGHAFLPGHGKTIMAAYLVGRRGRLRDVITVGATVTITHTAGVLVLGLLISVTTAFAPTAAEQDLGVVSGLIVAAVGVGLLVSALRRLRSGRSGAVLGGIGELEVVALSAPTDAPATLDAGPTGQSAAGRLSPSLVAAPPTAAGLASLGLQQPTEREESARGHSHPEEAAFSHHPGVGVTHAHPHGPGHGHSHGHPHRSDDAPRFSRGGLVGLGVAGGLVPSPSALLVLLAAIALGRTVFGIVVVLGYGIGMAAALSAAGLLLVRLRRHADRFVGTRMVKLNRLAAALPALTATLVLLVGVWLTLRAVGGTI